MTGCGWPVDKPSLRGRRGRSAHGARTFVNWIAHAWQSGWEGERGCTGLNRPRDEYPFVFPCRHSWEANRLALSWS